MGKVVVRDSTAASRAWDDFGVHFVDLAQLCHESVAPGMNFLESLDDVIESHLEQIQAGEDDYAGRGPHGATPHYHLLLSRLLSSTPLSPHQTFRHPVACVIAISSHASNPIETLRQLYAQTAHGNRTLPMYVNPDYLRYYVLLHDEERSDFSKTSLLFDQMKRHFGLHCHLLRIRSSPCASTDDDAVEVPATEWQSPTADAGSQMEASQLLDLGDSGRSHVYESDVQALRAFVRELVAQSVVPHMESRIAIWNDQIASRRRGISGRIATFSKRWAGFGSGASSRNTSSTALASNQSGNYEPLQGVYRYDTSEAQLHKMADYAQMLRDYKLAASTYELLRTDFSNDKAWKHLACANEMSVVSGLLNPLAAAGAKGLRLGEFDAMLETATYSYITRCSDPTAAIKAVLTAIELLKVRGRAASELGAHWGIKCLEWHVLGDLSRVLVSERVISCLDSVANINGEGKPWGWGRRKRKAAMWSVVTAEEWMKLGQVDFAALRLEDADRFYEDAYSNQHWRLAETQDGWHAFEEMQNFVQQLRSTVRIKRGQTRRRGRSDAEQIRIESEAQQAKETLDLQQSLIPESLEKLDARPHRRSLIGALNTLEVPPLSPVRSSRRDSFLMSSPRPRPRERDSDFT